MTYARLFGRAAPLSLLGALALSGCMMGPTYHRPSVTTPVAFKEADGWAPANPSDAADKSDWWTAFGDPILNRLEETVATSNLTLAADAAAYTQAHELVIEDRASLFPSINLTPSLSTTYSGAKGATVITGSGLASSTNGGSTTTIYQPAVSGSWAPDFWGAVRRNIESAKANAQSSAATLANAKLTLQTELASDYISLRELDEEKRLYDAEIVAFEKSLQVVQNQYDAGNAAKSALLTAQTTLKTAQAADVDLARQRALMEHAIALLISVPPAQFSLAPAPWSLTLPQLPATVPSTLLQRRPDVAQAERAAASANALIGVQVAAFFPAISLTGNAGGESTALSRVFKSSNLFWTLGASASEPVFDAGLHLARYRAAKAAYDQAVATYRQTVIAAFGNVEDNLAAQRVYANEIEPLSEAARAAVENQTISLNEYEAGTVDYTTVAAAEGSALSAQLSHLSLQASQLATAVSLIESLGGGWTDKDLPKG
ncbi:MAG: efflux transporter outer membrane subunit [Alphaproteobacteria bacterium]|nr:efflux transporter outer membrane subunit [Alphaproteobacteria bacterium]